MSNTKDQVQADSKDQISADNNNTLGVLEEDDEFEEFAIAGPYSFAHTHVLESNKVD